MSMGIVATVATVGATAYSMSSSRKAGKAAMAAAKEEAKRINWNADEVQNTVAINDRAYAFDIEANRNIEQFNEQQVREAEAYTRWATAFNETLARRGKRRQMGTQRVAMAASGVASGGSMSDVMRDSEIETELQIQADVYSGLREADNLRKRANILRYESDVADWNRKFARSEAARTGELEAEDLRWQAKVAEMGGMSQASALKRQGYATLLSGAAQTAGILSDL